jgi:hypothetical protein
MFTPTVDTSTGHFGVEASASPRSKNGVSNRLQPTSNNQQLSLMSWGVTKTTVKVTDFPWCSVYFSVYIAIYARISTDKQNNLNQLDQLRAFAATMDWRIKQEYVDVATGKNGDREQFKALFAAVSRREFELVLFWSLDRFSREGEYETLRYLQTLTGHGGGYRSFTEQYL